MMRQKILISFFVLMTVKAYSQNNMVTLSGGYAFANIEDIEANATGYRINGLYEFNATGSKLASGLSIGYINIAASEVVNQESITGTMVSVPVYYAPKFLFGKEKFKGFVKGAVGGQFASLERKGYTTITDHDFGFYGGVGAGFMIFITDKIFVNGEYEIAWASNSLYRDGWINSAMGGIGIKF